MAFLAPSFLPISSVRMNTDIFAARPPYRGTYFTAYETSSSGLFTDPRACAEWTYHHHPNGYYAIPVWERVRIIGRGPLMPDQPEEVTRRIWGMPLIQGINRDLAKGVFGCIARGATGHFFQVYGFPTRRPSQEFAKVMGGVWIVATMFDWVSMY